MKRLFGLMLTIAIISSVAAAQNITIKSPNGGENWKLGETKPITWTSTGVTTKLRITLWRNGQQVGTVISNLPPQTVSYNWKVGSYEGGTAPAGPGYKIRVRQMGTPVIDNSNNPFTIQEKGTGGTGITFNPGLAKGILKVMTPKITQPHKGTNWKEGSSETIRWETGMKPPFKVELFNYNGKKKVRDCLGTVQSQGGEKYSLQWYIPKDVYKWPGNYTIKVSQGNIAGISDMFHISKAIKIKTYTFSATTVNKVREKWYKPNKNVFTAKIDPSVGDPGPGKMRVGYENHDTPDIYTGFVYRSWVYFNLGSLKGLVSKATLSFKRFMGCSFTPAVYVLNQKWSGDPMALFSIPGSKIDPSANLGLIVNGWISKGDNWGFVFVGQNESFPHNNSQCVGLFEDVKLTVEIIEDVK